MELAGFVWQAWSEDDGPGSWAWGKLHADGRHEVYGDGLSMAAALAAVDSDEGPEFDLLMRSL